MKEFLGLNKQNNEIKVSISDDKLNSYFDEMMIEFEESYLILDAVNESYGEFLLNYLNNKFDKIKLTRRYLDD